MKQAINPYLPANVCIADSQNWNKALLAISEGSNNSFIEFVVLKGKVDILSFELK